jgi:hypothetical protein
MDDGSWIPGGARRMDHRGREGIPSPKEAP